MAFEFSHEDYERNKSKLLSSSRNLGTVEHRESELKFTKYRKPIGDVSRPAFSSTADRFENHTSLKMDSTMRHKLNTQDLGPGTHEIKGLYEHQMTAPSVMGKVHGGSLCREDRKMLLRDMKSPNNTAPGCYEIPSYFKESHQHRQLPGSVGGSSAFLSSGRKVEILPDGKYFQSAHPETRTDHIGPGYYQTPMITSGQMPAKHTVFPGTATTHYSPNRSIRTTAKLDMSPPRAMLRSIEPSQPHHPSASTDSLLLPSTSKKDSGPRPAHSNFLARQIQLANEDIDAVRDLPMDMFYS
mmetsp:Transcript_37428/g.47726  ORF Transcript_37428/g.47726 Transcript_37428/m.47726 type:complete len:298 (-) Transcript_37428:163-1056(-)